jgi:hypothetical protein
MKCIVVALPSNSFESHTNKFVDIHATDELIIPFLSRRVGLSIVQRKSGQTVRPEISLDGAISRSAKLCGNEQAGKI